MAEREIQVVDTLAGIDPAQWNALAGPSPTLAWEFLHALHESGCASAKTGWQPRYLLLRERSEGGEDGEGGALAGAMLLYAKSHSRGEYVFDHAWADAFHRNGLEYYPKLLSAVPFTPVSGPRLLARSHADRVLLARAAIQLARTLECSSLHVLFPDENDLAALREVGYLMRGGVQFHWENAGYADFDSFLANMKMEKRKKLRQERRKVADAGVTFRHLRGADITASDMRFFHQCYVLTYEAHFSQPYLTLAFFERIRQRMGEHILLVLAERDGAPIAAALNLVGGNVMYGRYWGAREFVSGLHFDTCYLQAIAYCIAHGIDKFEGGAQGEHKMSRGLVPTPTASAHWIADRRFADAIADFLSQEGAAMDDYIDELAEHVPFKQGPAPVR